MLINKALVLIMFLILIFNFWSCDPELGYEYYINNKSDSVLMIKFRSNYLLGSKHDSVKYINPKSETIICEMSVFGGSNPHDENDDFLKLFDTISITTQNFKNISKDYKNRKNWTYDNEIVHFGLIKTGTNIYKFELSNNEIK